MRARMALMHCGAQCTLREIALKNKPAQLLKLSSKGTVPVLMLPTEGNGFSTHSAGNSTTESITDDSSNRMTAGYSVIDESIDIMHWAMKKNPSRDLLNSNEWLITETLSFDEIDTLIWQNDFEFKEHLDKYKYSDRHPEHQQTYYLQRAMPFLEKLDELLSNSPYLGGSQFRYSDAAILPFVRQFSMVEHKQFNALALPNLQRWLSRGLECDLFASVMHKVPLWNEESGEGQVVFGKGK